MPQVICGTEADPSLTLRVGITPVSKEEGHTPVRRTSEGPAGAPLAPIPTSAWPTYQPDAPARVPGDFPRWRAGLVCASVRIFLAGVIWTRRFQ
jgi:hypothetical protein